MSLIPNQTNSKGRTSYDVIISKKKYSDIKKILLMQKQWFDGKADDISLLKAQPKLKTMKMKKKGPQELRGSK